MLAKLLKLPGAPEAQPAAPDPRDQLRQAQEAAGQAAAAAQRASGHAERARVAVDRARAALARYDQLDDAVVQHRAEAIRSGRDDAALSPDLVERRREQAAAARELRDAEATLGVLEEDERAARQAHEKAQAALIAAADTMLMQAATGMLAELQEVEADAARKRAVLASLLASRTPSDPAVPWPLQQLIHDPAHDILLSRAGPGAAVDAGAWQRFRRALVSDAAASFPAP